ncbi:MAG: hypothetical protein E6G14_01405 [Actinobacteria bacterium]|nr:MAG: hypothetical protein E6G14_01405 [Actinomycetota bacterium]
MVRVALLAIALGTGLVAASANAGVGLWGPSHQARATIQAGPEFTLTSSRGLVGGFVGYGGQLNQHVYANISGPPSGLPDLEAKVLALQPQFVRVFFNTSEWQFPDRMLSFVRTVGLAQRTQAQINITWQGSSFAFAMANMPRFADVLADLLTKGGLSSLWMTLFNEPNSTRLTLSQYEQVCRSLDDELRNRGVRDRVHFMGGDLVGTTSPLGQTQLDWFQYMASHMGDLLDAWSVHVYWNFWDSGKIDRRLRAEVRTIFSTIPAPERRPLYVTEFGVRGVATFEGETNFSPGLWPNGTAIEQTTTAAFQEAWFMIRAAQLGFAATAKWDVYAAKYDAGTQDYSAIGLGAAGWPLRPVYRVLQLLTVRRSRAAVASSTSSPTRTRIRRSS